MDSYNLFDDDNQTVEEPNAASYENPLDEQRALTDRLDEASKLYYQGKQSEFSDIEFDLQLHRLEEMEKQSGTIFPNSPTQRVGSDIQDGFDKVKHPIPMLTIDNTYKQDDLNAWLNKQSALTYEISTKFDGVSLEIHYKDGIMLTASTRGDKNIGDDVTANAKTIKTIPLSLNGNKSFLQGKDIYVRGEVLMPRSVFNEINEELAASGKKLMANCRNACSGTIKQLDSRITAARKLTFRPWDIIVAVDGQVHPEYANCDLCTFDLGIVFDYLGFYMEDFAHPVYANKEDVLSAVEEYKKNLDDSHPDFDYDGVVIKVLSQEERMKTVDHRAIEWGIARKWNEEREAITILESVTWQVGRQGAVTPVANFKPIPLDGVTVTNATLHNVGFIEKRNLTINDAVKITRSGGVIPYVLCTVPIEDYVKKNGSLPDGLSEHKEIEIPELCPVCGEELVFDGEILKCPNASCPAQINGRIENWCSKDVMNIQDIGPEVIADMVEKNVICEPLDLYELEKNYTPSELADILGAGYGEKSIKKYYKNIRMSKSQPLDRIISGLSIEGIGKQNSRNLVKAFKSFENLMNASVNDLKEIDGIGDVLAANIHQFMIEDGQYWFDKMTEIGLQLETTEEEKPNVDTNGVGPVLEGLKIVFSGSSKYFPGDSSEDFLESFGAKCGHSVSKKTNYLVIGENPGPKKLQTAKDYGIEIVPEDDFYKKFGLNVE